MKMLDSAGRLLVSLISPADPGVFGDGSDGSVTFDGSATVLGFVPASGVYTKKSKSYALSGFVRFKGMSDEALSALVAADEKA